MLVWFIIRKDGGIWEDQRKDGQTKESTTDIKVHSLNKKKQKKEEEAEEFRQL